MAVAIIKHAELKAYAEKIGFPLSTKVTLVPEGKGYAIFDQFIRENVQWVNEVSFDPAIDIKITESAQLVGEIPEPWALRCQKFLEGTPEVNSFQPLDVDGIKVDQLVNQVAIQDAIAFTLLKYRVDFDKTDQILNTTSSLKLAIFDTAEDSSISYASDVPVKYIYLTKVEVIDGVNKLFKQTYFEQYDPDAYNPWLFVGELSDEEYEVWREHNVKPEVDVLQTSMEDFRKIGDAITGDPQTKPANPFPSGFFK